MVHRRCTRPGVEHTRPGGEHTLPGGMVYVKFKDEADAAKCKVALAGRWFDGRQLVVEYKSKEEFPDDCEAV